MSKVNRYIACRSMNFFGRALGKECWTPISCDWAVLIKRHISKTQANLQRNQTTYTDIYTNHL